MNIDVLIIGAGISGLSASYHIGHEKCLLLESKERAFGHCKSDIVNEFIWDQGPHVSFTKHDYVKNLFAKSVKDQFDEYDVNILNYANGCWVNHPVQSHLYQLSPALRVKCVDSLLGAITRREKEKDLQINNYHEWLYTNFGDFFSEKFPEVYTRKYWTVDAEEMTTAWVGNRIYLPSKEDVLASSEASLPSLKHYISKVRYPREGGYQSFMKSLLKNARIYYGSAVEKIDLDKKEVICNDGSRYKYGKLISTMPLPRFIGLCVQASDKIQSLANNLKCTKLLLVNVEVPHEMLIDANWIYVYDKDKYSTRIHYTNKLTSRNVPEGYCGIQVEVYASRDKPFNDAMDNIAKSVVDELVDMGLINKGAFEHGDVNWWFKEIPYANIIFDQGREDALNSIFNWLCKLGLNREDTDLDSSTDWDKIKSVPLGDIIFSGRFGQWKYYWSDDCVLRGLHIAKSFDIPH